MERPDPQLAQRVWERVRGGQPPEDPAQDLRTMLTDTLADQSAYSRLAERSSPRLRALSQDCRRTAACLRGLHLLLTGSPPPVSLRPTEDGPARTLLPRCYSRTLSCLELCLRWQEHPRCGPALAVLARQLRDRCCLLAELLGEN